MNRVCSLIKQVIGVVVDELPFSVKLTVQREGDCRFSNVCHSLDIGQVMNMLLLAFILIINKKY